MPSPFAQAVAATPNLTGALKPGLQAIPPKEMAPRLETGNPRRIVGSVHVDKALQRSDPHGNRWDFAIAVNQTDGSETVHWIEVHGAQNETDAKTVLQKYEWLLRWWSGDGKALSRLKRAHPVYLSSSGSVRIPRHHPVNRLLAKSGLIPRGSYTLC
jgi:hypothetical protein